MDLNKSESQSEKSKSQYRQNKINQIRKKISKYSYNESLKEIDDILSNMQSDSVAIEDLYEYYLTCNLLLEQCQNFLNIIEQEVIEINTKDFIEGS